MARRRGQELLWQDFVSFAIFLFSASRGKLLTW